MSSPVITGSKRPRSPCRHARLPLATLGRALWLELRLRRDVVGRARARAVLVDTVDEVVVFWDGASMTTALALDLARSRKRRLHVIDCRS